MGDLVTYVTWFAIIPVGIGVILAVLSVPLCLIAGMIWKQAAPRTIALATAWIAPALLITYFFVVLISEFTSTAVHPGHGYAPSTVFHNFAMFGAALILCTLTSVFLGRTMGANILSSLRGHR